MKEALNLEIRKNCKRLYIRLFFVFIVVVVLVSQIGIEKYKHEVGKEQEFVNVEKSKIERYMNYTQFGIMGYHIFLTPPPFSALFYNSTTITELQALINSTVVLTFLRFEEGENIFKRPTGGSLDLSWFFLNIGGGLILLWCFFTFRGPDYIRFLLDAKDGKTVFFSIILARILLVLASLLIIMGVVILQFLVNGLSIDFYDFILFFSGLALVLILLISISSSFGFFQNWLKGALYTAGVCVFLFFILPEALNILIEIKSTNIKSRYQHELDKLKVVVKFEREAYERSNRYKNRPEEERRKEEKKEAESYWLNEFLALVKFEQVLMKELAENTHFYQFLCIFNPATFYREVNNELSGKGFNAYLLFFDYCLANQKEFVRFYIDKKYGPNYTVIEPFIKNGENIYHSKSSLPNIFIPGIILILFYIGLLLFISLLCFLKKFSVPKGKEPDQLQIEFEGKNTAFMLCRNNKLKNEYFCFYRHQPRVTCIDKINTKDFKLGLRVSDMVKHFCNITGTNKEKAFDYLSRLNIKDFNTFKVSHEDILKIYFAVKAATDGDLIVINDFFKKEYLQFEEDFLKLLTYLVDNGKKIIYLSSEMYYPKVALNGKIIVDFKTFPLDFKEVTLR